MSAPSLDTVCTADDGFVTLLSHQIEKPDLTVNSYPKTEAEIFELV